MRVNGNRARSQSRNANNMPNGNQVSYQPVMLMPQQHRQQPAMMMQPVYQYMPQQQKVNQQQMQQPQMQQLRGVGAGGIHNKMRQTQQRVQQRRMSGGSATIESRVLLPNGRSVNQQVQQRGGGQQPRMIEDRLTKPAMVTQQYQQQRGGSNQQRSQQAQQSSNLNNSGGGNRRQMMQQSNSPAIVQKRNQMNNSKSNAGNSNNMAKKTLRLNPQSKRIQKEHQPIRSKASAANQKQYRVKGSATSSQPMASSANTSSQQQQLRQKKNQIQKSQSSAPPEKKSTGLPLLGKNMVLPIPNPTGNPYDRPNLAKINDEAELKGLQVKAELDKLGAPSRSFSEYLLLEPGAPVGGNAAEGETAMEDCAVLGNEQRMSLSQRFSRIERARPAVHPITIQLANKLKTAQQAAQSQSSGNPEQRRPQSGKTNAGSSRNGDQQSTSQNNYRNQQLKPTARQQNRYRK